MATHTDHPHSPLAPEPPEGAELLDDAPFRGRGRGWRPRVEPHERRLVIEQLFGNGSGSSHWVRYAVMLTLSAVIATAGLSADSGAVVIGAMLVAPLMTPIVGFVAAISLNMPRRALIASAVVVGSTIWTIAVAFGVAAILPDTPLGGEVLARTAPDVRDLLVALAAGVAGTWATARVNVSAALPGVAIAVALVPPLATVGLTIHAGEMQYAEGALLLYVTNLVAIVGIGALTMVAVGFVPTSLLTRSWHTLGTTTVISLILIGAISWPLWHTAERAAREARVTSELEAVVGDWLGAVPSLEVDSIERNGRSVTIDVVGPVEPPPADELSRAIVARLDDRYDVRVRWAQRIDRPISQGDEELDESPIDAMGEVVDEWLVAVERPDLSIEAITMSGSDVVVRVVGPRKPPSGAVLRQLIADRFPETEYQASVAWTQISVIDDQTATLDALRSEVSDAARTWAADVGVEIVDVTATFDEIVVRTAGLDPPIESGALHDAIGPIASAYGVDPAIVVTFEQRQVIPAAATPTTTTPPPTTTTTTTTTTPATTAPTIAAAPTTSAPATAAP